MTIELPDEERSLIAEGMKKNLGDIGPISPQDNYTERIIYVAGVCEPTYADSLIVSQKKGIVRRHPLGCFGCVYTLTLAGERNVSSYMGGQQSQ